jgi:VanZ family protein
VRTVNGARVHLAIFVLLLAAWTCALWSPVPHESAREALGSDWHVFLFGKGLHISVYAFLTILGGTVCKFGKRWWWVLPVLVAHGGLIEVVQPYVGRTGSLRDVGLDTLGIVIGGMIVWIARRVRGRNGKSAA